VQDDQKKKWGCLALSTKWFVSLCSLVCAPTPIYVGHPAIIDAELGGVRALLGLACHRQHGQVGPSPA